ncbi:MAG: hypothetical protein WDA16_11880 [Candidatus Thermoplasmatota archaeon]
MWIWYLDRGTALVSLVALWFAVLTGILYNARAFGALHRAARTIHVPSSVVASVTILLHVGVGLVDAWLVLTRRVPHPAYSDAYFAVGLVVGASALVLTVTSVLAFADAKSFQRPWDPKLVHMFAYGGFVFATLHGAAVGTDLVRFIQPGLVATCLFLLYVLVLRFAADKLSTSPTIPAAGPPDGP